ncbi:mandelate racemase/muconate lactonizing enzyme family protein [Ancylobacter mangrovi]|uniref:Mandelate racemase/muconate lactonizing enzyme family protein n=1 Tax=Ancylobacter mangrovi TaxID=2972472 RepID=A0A9X2PIT1_9HYPH|nr:mandelate racemase/muconate lactonizing enzyme family protein [Ancylobacter mangrovi]MCS0496890.1 mandelate racemase/muconate lactonizing enzyme family protein [Ancylobacter mangrovi]MCS0504701.1 mandelate racemase/muconate lactonizing enzyme family protein [Ancylobacter mangrovi]
MTHLRRIRLSRLRLPLIRPYRLSYRTFDEFEPYLVEVEDSDGRTGFADAHISPGSSSETREGGWAFCLAKMDAVLGKTPEEAKAIVLADFASSKVAATALTAAIEVLEGSDLLDVGDARSQPLLTPINALEPEAIVAEVEEWIGQGFRTFKVKVGKDVEADLARVAVIQKAVGERATLRLDANRAFSRAQGIAFASRLDPSGIELFEQPCDSDDWEANAAVAAASTVPLMLDEPICTLADIDRAAGIEGVGFCKLKLKRFGSLQRLAEGLNAVRANGMSPVLGDGLGSEVQGWLEACVARDTVDNAGEFNGFLKPRTGLFANPLPFVDGEVRMPAGYRPQLDRDAVARATTATHELVA